jgi:hypothetical protein
MTLKRRNTALYTAIASMNQRDRDERTRNLKSLVKSKRMAYEKDYPQGYITESLN